MSNTMLFAGRNRVRYNYARFGYTRGGGKTWHGGLDIEALDDTTIRMPYYDGKLISGTVTRARIVTDKTNPTWEWGYYVCVQLDANQTPDAVNYLYFCHCSKLLVQAGQKVRSGDALAVMGNTGNAALASPPYAHVHFEVRDTATGKGLDPTHYAGIPNAVGTYGEEPQSDGNAGDANTAPRMQRVRVTCHDSEDGAKIGRLLATLGVPLEATVSDGDAFAIMRVAQTLGCEYNSEYVQGDRK